MLYSVAICTWNRARLLDRTLTALRELRVPAGADWELLVVNNNCTDQTDEVIDAHRKRLPLRRICETRQGLSHARNTAVTAARGEMILWTDDDVLVDPDWLTRYARAARRWPDAVYFGGLIEPWFETSPPAWVSANLNALEGMLVIRNLGAVEGPFEEGESPFGANMAFRREVFEGRAFDPALGRCARDCILGDEVTFIGGLRRAGCQGVWVPGARVRHFVSGERLTRSYLWAYFHGLGRTAIRTEGIPAGRRVGGVPRWLYGRCVRLWLRSCLQRFLRRPTWVASYLRAAHAGGMIAECQAPRPEAGGIVPGASEAPGARESASAA
jgi:glycosyltransferase involved in cell wall biosynthesis